MLNTFDLAPTTMSLLEASKAVLNSIDSLCEFARKISRESQDLSQLGDYERSIGLRKDGIESQSHEGSSRLIFETIRDMGADRLKSIPLSNLSTLDLFTNADRTLVYAESNIGKSFVTLEMAGAIAAGRSTFFLKAAQPEKVLYLDGELGNITFKSRVEQLHVGNQELIVNNLFRSGLRGVRLGSEDIEDILQFVKNDKIRVVIIDNIISLFPEAVRGNTERMMTFIHDLEHARSAVILVHHTEKTGKYPKGVVEIEDLCQNILKLTGREQILEDFKKKNIPISSNLETAINTNGGPVVGIYGQKCKVCPELEGQTFYYRLPIDGTWERIDTDLDEFRDETSKDTADEEGIEQLEVAQTTGSTESQAVSANATIQETPIEQLKPEELMVLQTALEQNFMKNSGVQKLLSCGDSKASALLSRLCSDGWLRRLGKGSATTYRLTDKARSWLKEMNAEREG